MKDQKLKHSLLIGGTRGLGRALTRCFSDACDCVSVVGRHPPAEGDSKILNTRYWTLDLQDQKALSEGMKEIIEIRGPPTKLVFLQRFRGKENDWEGEIATSISASRFIIEEFAATCVEPSSVVFVSSVAGDYVIGNQPVSYHLGKSAMNQLMRYYAVKLGPKGVRVNAVSPFSFIKEESREFYTGNKPLQDLYKKLVPLGRMGTTEDIVNVIKFLCSNDASFLTGQNLYIDGGLSLRWPEEVGRQLTGI